MKLIVIFILLFCSIVRAQNIIDNPELLYQMPVEESSVLNQKVTVNWKFSSFNDFIISLQKNYQINSKIVSNAPKPANSVLLTINNGSIEQLITAACSKFGYTWIYKDNVVVFRAINQIAPTKTEEKLQSNWQLNPSDKTLRAVLSKWCKSANWQLIWNVHADYPITTTWAITGNFETAVNEVLKASQETDVPLVATMHDSNRVLEISSPSASIK